MVRDNGEIMKGINKNKTITECTSCQIPKRVQNDKRKMAFTLAEALIAILIIGIIAAMTLPNLIVKYQKKQTVAKLKKVYAEMAQAISMSEAEYGPLETWDFSSGFSNALARGQYFGEKYLFPHIKTSSICVPSSNKCWADNVTNINGQVISNLLSNGGNKGVSFTTVSGYSVFYWLHGVGDGMWYFVDINGYKKKPNRIGKDIFAFVINWGRSNSKVGYYPAGLHVVPLPSRQDLINGTNGISQPVYRCQKFSTNIESGAYCTGLIVLDGWKISDDYPW